MAVQLTAYYWLRNNDLHNLLDGRREARLTDTHRNTLKELIRELDALAESTDSVHDSRVIHTPHVLLSGVERMIPHSTDRQRSGQLLDQVAGIMAEYPMRLDAYRRLGEAYEEIGATPAPDVARAVAFAELQWQWSRYPATRTTRWTGYGSRMLLPRRPGECAVDVSPIIEQRIHERWGYGETD